MLNRAGLAGAMMLACGLLTSCGGGGGGGSSGTASPAAVDNSAAQAAAAAAAAAEKVAKEADADRLARQATFGPTTAVVDRIVSIGASAWIDEQLAANDSTYADVAGWVSLDTCASADNVCNRRYFSRELVAMRFYQNALSKPDQLRQRVAFALSQLLVTSTLDTSNASGMAGYQQVLLSNALGNYRDLLMAVTLNSYMGAYLDVADSNKAAPSENYAREMLQLFTMGPDQLNMDGTPVKDATGATIANYSADDIKGIARALTGWTYAHANGGGINDYNSRDYAQPMIVVPGRYDTAAKSFLGVTVPAGASQADSVAAAVNAAFNNASTAPHIAHFLIQHLVTSNPTQAYVARVAAVFANNGSNVRGDMKAVVRAILTDAEARGANKTGDNAGKVKEPVLLMTGIGRAIGMTTDGYAFTARDGSLGQQVFQAPSVFNFYPPDFPLPGSTTLVSPASKLLTTGFSVLRSNLAYDWTVGAATTRGEFAVNSAIYGSTGSSIDWSAWEAFGTDIDGMIDRIDYLLMNRQMSAAQKAALKSAATPITDATPSLQARKRAQAMLYAVLSSPFFQVDR
ncbi:DUF1800 domain-containing protein [Sphingomonas sp. AP4-R1]|uniref:DUF1800 domain-containing protein n=1 Tax=Sphingomonas sp. AP4-R1 TaxID=2735134 RepID=UPI0014936867|nr:DUF1800 family protein [Sphingomonas sp. AP4-R1]QJU57677.1 DUF1800 domain-containing protein [Sphingomonas sp. AP4-R1]